MPESRDQEIAESRDQEIAESRDQEMPESIDQEMPESIDQHNTYLYKFNILHSLNETSARHSFALCVLLVKLYMGNDMTVHCTSNWPGRGLS